MDHYVTGAVIKRLRENRKMTQLQLAEKLCVSDKTISKWETGKGFPDVSLMEPLAQALQISIPELLSGREIRNANRSANMLRSALYVCPVCGNIIHATGSAMVSCCGVTLPQLEAEEPDEAHDISCEIIDEDYYITVDHPMTKQHYISFLAYVNGDRFELVKLYPEGNAEARFYARKRRGMLYWYCNHDGLFYKRL